MNLCPTLRKLPPHLHLQQSSVFSGGSAGLEPAKRRKPLSSHVTFLEKGNGLIFSGPRWTKPRTKYNNRKRDDKGRLGTDFYCSSLRPSLSLFIPLIYFSYVLNSDTSPSASPLSFHQEEISAVTIFTQRA